jgi:hypothetical protein
MDSANDLEREILTRGGEIRVLLQDPNQKDSINMLHYQLDNMLSHMLESDIERSVNILKALSKRRPGVSYRFAAYSPGFSLVVLDPDGRNGRAIVELFGVTNEVINDRMHIEIHREGSHYWFEHWSRQFELMWENSREPDPETGL